MVTWDFCHVAVNISKPLKMLKSCPTIHIHRHCCRMRTLSQLVVLKLSVQLSSNCGRSGPQTVGAVVLKLCAQWSSNCGRSGPQTVGAVVLKQWALWSSNCGRSGLRTVGAVVLKLWAAPPLGVAYNLMGDVKLCLCF